MVVHLVNPSDFTIGTAGITPRWLYVLAAATPAPFGDPHLTDEVLKPLDLGDFNKGDVVGIGIHTLNALRGYEIGRQLRERGATVVFGGVHATLFPQEATDLGGAHAVVTGDGEMAWPQVLADYQTGTLKGRYDGGRVPGRSLMAARWDLLPPDRYLFASVQTLRGCPKHCSFCSVWRTDGQEPRQRGAKAVSDEILELRSKGFKFIMLSDDNFYPVTLEDLDMAKRRKDPARLAELEHIRAEQFALMDELASLPKDLMFFTQITMEAAEDPEFLDAMNRARIRGVLIGIESITEEGLKSIYKKFNASGAELVEKLRAFRRHGVHVLGSFIFGLSTDTQSTFEATVALAEQADLAFAQFVPITPFPGTIDFTRWEQEMAGDPRRVDGVPLTRYWLIPSANRPKVYLPHPDMTADEIRGRTGVAWQSFYQPRKVWARASGIKSFKGRLAFTAISLLYSRLYGQTGVATDSARLSNATTWAKWLVVPCRRLLMSSRTAPAGNAEAIRAN